MIQSARSCPIEGHRVISTSHRSLSETDKFQLEAIALESDHQAGDGVEEISSLSSVTTIEPSLLNHPHIKDLLHDPQIIGNPVASTIMCDVPHLWMGVLLQLTVACSEELGLWHKGYVFG